MADFESGAPAAPSPEPAAPIAPSPSPAPIPIATVDQPSLREAQPVPPTDAPVIDLDKPIAPQIEEHAKAVEEAKPAPIPLPRSWPQEYAESWAHLPRNQQELLSQQAQQATKAVRDVQNRAAEVERYVAEQARPHVERAQQVTRAYEDAYAGLFYEQAE